MKNAFKALVVVMAVVMIVLAFGQWSRQSRLGQLYPAAGSFVRVGDLSLHYEEAGRGYPVLLIHGSPGFTRDYKMTLADRTSVFEDLSRDFRVFAVDRPGNGWSDRGGRGGLGLKEQTAAMVGMGMMSAPPEIPRPLLSQLSGALTQFINNGGSLTIDVTPPEPVK